MRKSDQAPMLKTQTKEYTNALDFNQRVLFQFFAIMVSDEIIVF